MTLRQPGGKTALRERQMAHAELYFASERIFRDSLFYRKDSPIFSADTARAALERGDYRKVAEMPWQGDPEAVWCAAQNIDEPWCSPPERSMSVGDIVVVGEDRWIVASLGFEKL
jgi:hypothetical protein